MEEDNKTSVAVLEERLEQRSKTIFDRLEKQDKKIEDTNSLVTSIQNGMSTLENKFDKSLSNMETSLIGQIQSIMEDSHNAEVERLKEENAKEKEKNDKYFKWFFWLITAILGVFISLFIAAVVNP